MYGSLRSHENSWCSLVIPINPFQEEQSSYSLTPVLIPIAFPIENHQFFPSFFRLHKFPRFFQIFTEILTDSHNQFFKIPHQFPSISINFPHLLLPLPKQLHRFRRHRVQVQAGQRAARRTARPWPLWREVREVRRRWDDKAGVGEGHGSGETTTGAVIFWGKLG